MIKVASYPEDLTSWNGEEPPFYLEIFGETSPIMDSTYGEVLPPGGEAATTTASTPIYEYWWTIGHVLNAKTEHAFRSKSKGLRRRSEEPAARVYMYFPVNAGWRIKELIATTKYLSPAEHELSLSEKAADYWQKISPGLADAGTLAQVLKPIPGIGLAAAGAAPILSALSKLRIGSVPQGAEGFDWFVKKVTTTGIPGRGLMQGVMWALPKSMLDSLGGRLTGSLAVSFIPNRRQDHDEWTPRTGAIHAHASVISEGEKYWAPTDMQRFVELHVTPQWPDHGVNGTQHSH